MSTARAEPDKSGRNIAPISANYGEVTAPIDGQHLSEKPRWLDTIEDMVGPGVRPDRIYEDTDGNVHVIFNGPELRVPDY
jgi:hypothetical protein